MTRSRGLLRITISQKYPRFRQVGACDQLPSGLLSGVASQLSFQVAVRYWAKRLHVSQVYEVP